MKLSEARDWTRERARNYREPLTARIKIASLFFNYEIICWLCKVRLTAEDRIIWEHFTPVALGGATSMQNVAPVHHSCACKKTNGAGHVKVDGDISKIAKSKRIARAHQEHQAVMRGEIERPPGSIRNRNEWPKGQKLQSHSNPWPKRKRI